MSSSLVSEEVRARIRVDAKNQCGYCRSRWSRHFAWANDSIHIIGLTSYGRATVLALQLNNTYAVTVRQAWVSAGWHPPTEY